VDTAIPILLSSVLGIAAGLWIAQRWRQSSPQPPRPAPWSERAYDLLREIREGGTRYLVEVVDHGDEAVEPQMRWRWVVWDADRLLRAEAHPTERDPDGEAGVERPYMLGAAPSWGYAAMAAFSWVRQQGRGQVVVGGGIEGGGA
jgi:hypothetical protein